MNRRILRRIAVALISLLVFAQANVALAACPMERGGMLAPILQAGEPCSGCDTGFKPSFPELAGRCVAHCTADLQNTGPAAALVRSPGEPPALVVPAAHRPGLHGGLFAPPAGAPPVRIVLHSFLI